MSHRRAPWTVCDRDYAESPPERVTKRKTVSSGRLRDIKDRIVLLGPELLILGKRHFSALFFGFIKSTQSFGNRAESCVPPSPQSDCQAVVHRSRGKMPGAGSYLRGHHASLGKNVMHCDVRKSTRYNAPDEVQAVVHDLTPLRRWLRCPGKPHLWWRRCARNASSPGLLCQ